MAMQLHHQAGLLLNAFHQIVCAVGINQTAHILNADTIRTHCFQLFGQLHKMRRVVHRAVGIGNRHLSMCAVFFGGPHRTFHVAHIVQRVENTNDVNTVFHAFLHKQIHHIIRIMTIAQQILAAQQHLQLGVWASLADFAQPLPRIFIQKTHAAIKGGAAPNLHTMKTNFIQI